MADGDWLASSQTLEKFEAISQACANKGEDADAVAFAEASLALISVFDLINGMGMASGDMKGNATTIKDMGAGKTLSAIVKGECDGKSEGDIKKIAGDGKKGTCALLWLARALNFILVLLKELIDNPAKKLSDCVLAGYDVSLKPHHGMIIKGTFSVAVKAAPARDVFIKKLGPGDPLATIGSKLPAIVQMNKSIQDFLTAINAKHLSP